MEKVEFAGFQQDMNHIWVGHVCFLNIVPGHSCWAKYIWQCIDFWMKNICMKSPFLMFIFWDIRTQMSHFKDYNVWKYQVWNNTRPNMEPSLISDTKQKFHLIPQTWKENGICFQCRCLENLHSRQSWQPAYQVQIEASETRTASHNWSNCLEL